MWRGISATLIISACLVTTTRAAVQPQPSVAAGESTGTTAGDTGTLANALRGLRERGLNLVYSNALVPPDLEAQNPLPDPALSLEAQALELLAPFGLALRRAGSGLYYVVRAEPEAAPPTRMATTLQSRPRKPVEQVLVSATRYRLVRSDSHQQVLDHYRLEALPSMGRDLLRAVNQLPGQASVGVSARSHIRGGDNNEVLYLVDGVQILEPFHLSDFQSLFSTVNPNVVDAVNVYSSGFPATLGSRSSGVVSIELTEPTRPFEGMVDVNLVSASAHVQGYRGNWDWLVSARRSVVDLVTRNLERDYGKPRFHDQLARLRWQGSGTSAAVGMLGSTDELTLQDEAGGEAARADYASRAVWLNIDQTISDSVDLAFHGSFTRVDNERHGVLDDPADAVGILQESREFDVLRLSADLRWQPDSRSLVHAGLERQRQEGEFDVAIHTTFGALSLPLQPDPEVHRAERSTRDGTLSAAFVSASRDLTDRLTLEAGVRLDHQDNDPVHDRQVSPRLQLTYHTATLRSFINAGRYAQHQNLYELQLDDGLRELNAPQVSDQLTLGLDWAPSAAVELRAEAYWRDVERPWQRFESLYNRWVLLPELHGDRVGLAPSKARSYGVELGLEGHSRGGLRTWISAAFARAEDRINGAWRPRAWEQRQTWRAGLDWRPRRWRFGLQASYHTGWPTTTLVAGDLDSRPIYDDRLRDYFSLDLHAARQFQLGRHRIEAYLDLGNATMRQNIGGHRFEVEDGVIEREPRRLLPAIPTVGVSWAW